jgi:sulfur-oxidizing protein SoxZ
MASAPKPRIKVPSTAKAGEVIVIKTLISHKMVTGLGKDSDGNPIPRQIINKFTCEFNGQPVYSADLEPAISANPFFEFNAKVNESGTFKFTWVDDNGSTYEAEQKITVE